MPVSRVTVPAEFFDTTSAMMLAQPLPEFTFAKFVFASQMKAELMASEAAALLSSLGTRGPGSAGAGVLSLMDQQLAIARSPFAGAIQTIAELGQKGIGHTVRINRPVFAATTYTEASRLISQSTSISTTPIEMTSEQVAITIRRAAGPYDNTNSRVAPYAIDRMDASRSVHQLAAMVGTQLQYDRMRYLDTVTALKFDAGANVVRPGAVAADASFPGSGEVPLDLETLFRAEQTLKDLFIPRYADGSYLFVGSPLQIKQLKLDPDYARFAKESDALNPLLGETITKVGKGITVLESSTIVRDTTTVSGQTIQRGMMFGPGAVGYGIDDACRTAYSNDDNYGETAKIIWVAYEGMELLDNRFIVSVRSI
jgi:hypothetical protein